MHYPSRFLGALALLAFCGSAQAQTPPHPAWSFTANQTTAGNQQSPDVTLDPSGRFVVVWTSTDASGEGIYARRFSVRAQPLGPEFRVNVVTSGAQSRPAVTGDSRGRFVVVWQGENADGDQEGIVGRRFDAAGGSGGAFLVNASTAGAQTLPSVALDSAGRFVVAWESSGQDGSGSGIFLQRFDAAGTRLGAELAVNTYTTGDQRQPSVAAGASGAFVVVWQSVAQAGGAPGIFAQRFAAGGGPLGAEFRVDGSTGAAPEDPETSAAADGGFVVIWRDTVAGLPRIAGRALDAAGVARGAEFTAHAFTTTGAFLSSVAADATGRFVVTWDDRDGMDPGLGVAARQFDSDGLPRGPEFRAHFITVGDQGSPAVASDPVGNFVMASASNHADLATDDVIGQTFGALIGSQLWVDFFVSATSDGNRVFEPGETVEMVTWWRSESRWSSVGSLFAELTSFTGPPGAAYTFDPSSYNYPGPFQLPGDERSCNGCPFVGVSTPPARPVLHWDTVATEQLDDPGQDQRKMWTLHVGESFSDVARANPFYPFVETLLHHGVTAGCGGDAYCPAASTTREQMAVFVLVAKDGAGYLPRACGATPRFDDVPVSSPFCRWIEELARRGVVGGCTATSYCPSVPVSREQMPVFVLRTLDPALTPPPCTTDPYSDVPASSSFCPWIRELTARGVVTGCGGGAYCPASPVTREQMGVFIGVTFGLSLYGP